MTVEGISGISGTEERDEEGITNTKDVFLNLYENLFYLHPKTVLLREFNWSYPIEGSNAPPRRQRLSNKTLLSKVGGCP